MIQQGSVKKVTLKIRSTASCEEVRRVVEEHLDSIRGVLTAQGFTAIKVKKPTVEDVGNK